MISCWWWYGWQWRDARPVIAELDGGVEFDQSDLKGFSMRDVLVCHVADMVREGRDIESYGGGH